MKIQVLKPLVHLGLSIPMLFIPYSAHADLSYGAKFLVTTLGSCAAGGAGAYFVAENGSYDTQPKQILTFMGAATGCVTGALFSYAFFQDETSTLLTRVSAQQKTIQDLSLQLAQTQGEKQNGTFSPFSSPNIASLPNPFDQLDLKQGVAKSSFDPSNLPNGLNLKNCNKLWQYSLKGDGNDLQNIQNPTPEIVAVSKNFALVGFTFLYSPNECFSPSAPEGHYAEDFFPGLNDFLKRRVIHFNAASE